MASSPTVVLDNGGATIKAGIVVPGDHDDAEPSLIHNAVVRSKGDKTTYVGHEFSRCRDFASLHYRLPFEKGYLVDWDAQKAVWDGLFSSHLLSVDPPESRLLITEPYFNLANIQDVYDQFVFEEYEFHAYHRCTPAALVPHGSLFQTQGCPMPECCLIVDAGFSFTHVVPIIRHQVQWHAVKRLDVGGKLLTNHLKQLISYRQWNLMDDSHIVNHVKESCCYVSTRFSADLDSCRSHPPKNGPLAREYLLPNYALGRPAGVLLEPGHPPLTSADQVLVLDNERFTVPELFFRPDDIRLAQAGLPATIAASIACLPPALTGMFWANIGLIGGSTRFPGFSQRLSSELRALAPVEDDIQIYTSSDPVTEAYRSARSFVRSPPFASCLVTRAEYLESGSSAVRRKFATGHGPGLNLGQTGDDVFVDGDKVKVKTRDADADADADGGEGDRPREKVSLSARSSRVRGRAAVATSSTSASSRRR